MIHFNPETRTLSLLLKTSFYAFQVDQADCLVHLAWGPRPAEHDEALLLSGRSAYESASIAALAVLMALLNQTDFLDNPVSHNLEQQILQSSLNFSGFVTFGLPLAYLALMDGGQSLLAE